MQPVATVAHHRL